MHNLFLRARLKLTLWYVLVIALLSLSFSFVVYRLQMRELMRFEELQRTRLETRIEERMGIIQLGPRRSFILVDDELLTEVRDRLLFALGIFNSGVIIFSGVFGYLLAGKTLTPIQKMVSQQEQFVQDASHELRTPLTALRTGLEVYLRKKSPTKLESQAIIKSSYDEVTRLHELSNSLLELTRHHELVREPLDLDDLVKQVVTQFAPVASKRRLKLSSHLAPVTINADASAVTRIVSILVDNAIKYTHPGGKISLTLKPAKSKAILTVSDNGVGISQQDLGRIFDRFYRADTARAKGGYGLGLSLARSLTRAHKGTLTASSKPNKGSIFTLTLPL